MSWVSGLSLILNGEGKMPGKIIYEKSLMDMVYVFEDREDAGRMLAKKLRKLKIERAIILAIPSGGVPVGYAISRELGIPMDLMISRKVQIPYNPEAGFGAVAPDGSTILNEPLVRELGLKEEEITFLARQVLEEIERRNKVFRGDRPLPDLIGKTVILVDDGLASGYTMLAAIKSVKKRKPKRVIVAVPTAPPSSARLVAQHVDKLICLNIRRGPFFAVADAYQKWYDLKDREVMDYIRRVRETGLNP